MENTHRAWVLLCLSQAFVPVDLYQFKNCSSNQIHEISQNGMKSLIRYDESKGVKLDETVKMLHFGVSQPSPFRNVSCGV